MEGLLFCSSKGIALILYTYNIINNTIDYFLKIDHFKERIVSTNHIIHIENINQMSYKRNMIPFVFKDA